ncbi:DUF3150 domain-containing protein (plasmid) [Vibrio scophthalmi]|uniref:DUF3150 domain-containing protein n=1 Tax=Vibrio scophthalmi TaxID=45658 RepID=UPI003EB9C743
MENTFNVDQCAKTQNDMAINSNAHFAEEIQKGLVIIDVTTTGRDGEKTIQNSKIVIDDKQIKSKSVRKGRVEWFPRGELQFKNTLETKARRAIEARSVRFGRCHATPVGELEPLLKELEEIKAEFYESVEKTKLNYDNIIDEHKRNNPEIASLIDSLKTPMEDFFRRFAFNILPPMVFKPYFKNDEEELVKTLFDEIEDTIVEQATVVLKAIEGKPSIVQRSFNPVRALRDYIFSMSFKHDVLDRVHVELTDAINALPSKGSIVGRDYTYAFALVKNLTDVEKIRTCITPVLEPEVEPVVIPEVSKEALDDYSNVSTESSTSEPTPNPTTPDQQPSSTGFFW